MKVTWSEFCAWVAGRTVKHEEVNCDSVTIHFTDGSRAVVTSQAWMGTDMTPGNMEPPEVEVDVSLCRRPG